MVRPIMHYFGRLILTMNSRRGSARSSRPTASTRRSRTARWSEAAASFRSRRGIPGGLIRAAGVTLVGVLPTHRRRGILRRLMQAQIDDIHERGEPMAYLWASEDALYGRFGYGIASFSGNVEIPRDRAAFHDDFQLSGKVGSSRRTRPSSPSPRSSGGGRAQSRNVRAHEGLVAASATGRPGVGPRGRRRDGAGAIGARRTAGGVCALPAPLLGGARDLDRLHQRDRGDRRLDSGHSGDLAVPARHRLDGPRSRAGCCRSTASCSCSSASRAGSASTGTGSGCASWTSRRR